MALVGTLQISDSHQHLEQAMISFTYYVLFINEPSPFWVTIVEIETIIAGMIKSR